MITAKKSFGGSVVRNVLATSEESGAAHGDPAVAIQKTEDEPRKIKRAHVKV